MRLPVVHSISTKDGTSNKNARLTNMLRETTKTADKAVIRPGLVASDSYTGLGNGLIPFDRSLLVINDDLVSINGSDLDPWNFGAGAWSASTTYSLYEWAWYGGQLWFSVASGNTNHAPASGSAYWTVEGDREWGDARVYGIGDEAIVNGVIYYSLKSSNQDNNPESADPQQSGLWSTTRPETSGVTQYSMNAAYWCATKEAAMYAGMQANEGSTCAAFGATQHNHDPFVSGTGPYYANWLMDCQYPGGGYVYQNVAFGPSAFLTRSV